MIVNIDSQYFHIISLSLKVFAANNKAFGKGKKHPGRAAQLVERFVSATRHRDCRGYACTVKVPRDDHLSQVSGASQSLSSIFESCRTAQGDKDDAFAQQRAYRLYHSSLRPMAVLPLSFAKWAQKYFNKIICVVG